MSEKKSIDYDAILRKFVGVDVTPTYPLNDPFVFEDYVAATDGRVLCYIDKNLVERDYSTDKKIPNIRSVMPKEERTPFQFTRDMLFDRELEDQLSAAKKAIEEPAECSYCNGTGDCECTGCGDEHPCRRCDGEGYVEPKEPKPVSLCWISNSIVDYSYIKTVRTAAELAGEFDLEVTTGAHADGCLTFKFGQFNVILMPLRKGGEYDDTYKRLYPLADTTTN